MQARSTSQDCTSRIAANQSRSKRLRPGRPRPACQFWALLPLKPRRLPHGAPRQDLNLTLRALATLLRTGRNSPRPRASRCKPRARTDKRRGVSVRLSRLAQRCPSHRSRARRFRRSPVIWRPRRQPPRPGLRRPLRATIMTLPRGPAPAAASATARAARRAARVVQRSTTASCTGPGPAGMRTRRARSAPTRRPPRQEPIRLQAAAKALRDKRHQSRWPRRAGRRRRPRRRMAAPSRRTLA